MEISLVFTGIMTLIRPLLIKASEKAAETVGEKFAEKTLEKKFWKKIKNLFIADNTADIIERIENKTVATSAEIELIETKVTTALSDNPMFASEILSEFNLSGTELYSAELRLESIRSDMKQLAILYEEKRLAGIASEGDYANMIARTQRRLEKDEEAFINLIKKKFSPKG